MIKWKKPVFKPHLTIFSSVLNYQSRILPLWKSPRPLYQKSRCAFFTEKISLLIYRTISIYCTCSVSASSMESCLYHFSSLRMISSRKKPPLRPGNTTAYTFSILTSRKCCRITSRMRPSMAEATSAFTYQKFVHFALEETRKHTQLSPSPLQVQAHYLNYYNQCCLLRSIWFYEGNHTCIVCNENMIFSVQSQLFGTWAFERSYIF